MRFRIYTTRGHVATIEAADAEQAHRLFTGKEFPPGVRPAPTHPETGTAHVPYEGFAVHGSAAPVWDEWNRWYRDEFLPARAKYPVLDGCRGECMLHIVVDDDSPCRGTYNTTAERMYEDGCHAVGGCGSLQVAPR